MTRHDIEVLDTIGTPDYLNGDLSVEGTQPPSPHGVSPSNAHPVDVDVAPHMQPPNPEDSEGPSITTPQ